MLDQTSFLINFVENHRFVNHQASELRKTFKIKHKFEKPNNTRFATEYRATKSLLENKLILRALAEDYPELINESSANRESKEKFFSIVNNGEFWRNIKLFVDGLDILDKALTESEGTTCYVEFAYPKFMELLKHFEKDDLLGSLLNCEDAYELVDYRWRYMHTSCYGFAFLLNPDTANQPMFVGPDENDFEIHYRELKKHIKKIYVDKIEAKACLLELENFLKKYGRVNAENDFSNPRTFWETLGKRNYPKLANIAGHIFYLIASSCASERVWSFYSILFTKQRNRMLPENLEKLAFVYINQAILDPDNHKQYFTEHLDFFD